MVAFFDNSRTVHEQLSSVLDFNSTVAAVMNVYTKGYPPDK